MNVDACTPSRRRHDLLTHHNCGFIRLNSQPNSHRVMTTETPRSVRSTVISLFVCSSVCLSVGPLAIFKNHCPNLPSMYMLHVAVAWPSSEGSAIRYVLPVLRTSSCFHVMEGIGQNQRRRVCSVEFVTWRHLSDVSQRCLEEIARCQHLRKILPSPTASCYWPA